LKIFFHSNGTDVGEEEDEQLEGVALKAVRWGVFLGATTDLLLTGL